MNNMKVFLINSVPYGSTGNSMFEIAGLVEQSGGQALCATGFSRRPFYAPNWYPIAGFFDHAFHALFSRFTGRHGCFSKRATQRLLKKILEFSPDVIHLHNLHGWFVNLPMLFSFLKQQNIPVVWTLHDCWAFTGQCPHFTASGCEKWKTGCYNCLQIHTYPAAYVDATKRMWQLKKQWFTGVGNLCLAMPSHWLQGLAGQSFLGKYNSRVIPNGIDLAVFKPTESEFRKRSGLQGKRMILGVSFSWGYRKGLDIFTQLVDFLPVEYQIVLVGVREEIARTLPDRILAISQIENPQKLAEIYTAADVFVNPTREDNYPTVNMEALACGTPVITSGAGGSGEMIDASCGSTVRGNAEAFAKEIQRICETNPYSKEACVEKAQEFDKHKAFRQYLALFDERRAEII